jgi:hypothetical protein
MVFQNGDGTNCTLVYTTLQKSVFQIFFTLIWSLNKKKLFRDEIQTRCYVCAKTKIDKEQRQRFVCNLALK